MSPGHIFIFTVTNMRVESIFPSDSQGENDKVHNMSKNVNTIAARVVGTVHRMQWEINRSRTPKTGFWQLFPRQSSSRQMYCSRMPFGSRPVNHILVTEKWTVC